MNQVPSTSWHRPSQLTGLSEAGTTVHYTHEVQRRQSQIQLLHDALPHQANPIIIADDDVAGWPAWFSYSATGVVANFFCQDPDGCNISLDETNAGAGDFQVIVNAAGSNQINVLSTPLVSELNRDASMAANDTLMLLYFAGRYIELSRSPNN